MRGVIQEPNIRLFARNILDILHNKGEQQYVVSECQVSTQHLVANPYYEVSLLDCEPR